MADNLADLTDLIAAHREAWDSTDRWTGCSCGNDELSYADHPAHVALVVEQHTNRRITALEAELERYRAEERRQLEWARRLDRDDVRCPRCNLRYGERDQYGCVEPARAHEYDADELRAALEGEQQ